VNNTLGRLDLSVIFVPTFMYIRDPFADSGSEARETLVSTQGMQLGREAQVARQWEGYHKATAGTDVTLPLVTRSPVLGRADDPSRLNEELLNPAGLNAYRWASGGNTVIAWGGRTLDPTTVYKWKHKREQLSHYENVLIENFDWSIFAINDPIADADVLAAMHTYFLDEYRKRAIRGDGFVGGRNPAAIIKMDQENNTDATRGQGDQNIEVSMRLADTVERLKIIIGALGLTESR
jgi:phage tail sheath protein FI